MTIFVVIAQPNPRNELLPASVENAFAGDFLKVADGVWLVSAKSTAKEVAEKLDVPEGTKGSAIVADIGAYWGRAPKDVWSWMSSRLEKTGG